VILYFNEDNRNDNNLSFLYLSSSSTILKTYKFLY